MQRRILAGAVTTILFTLAAAVPATADPGAGQGTGPGACFGPPGQTGLVQLAHSIGTPPGQIVSLCNGHGHGQNQGGG